MEIQGFDDRNARGESVTRGPSEIVPELQLQLGEGNQSSTSAENRGRGWERGKGGKESY
jgi:hypothetical protein